MGASARAFADARDRGTPPCVHASGRSAPRRFAGGRPAPGSKLRAASAAAARHPRRAADRSASAPRSAYRTDHGGVVAAAVVAPDTGNDRVVSCLARYIATLRGRVTIRARRSEVISASRMVKCSATRRWISSIATRRSCERKRSCNSSWALSSVMSRPTSWTSAVMRFSAPSSLADVRGDLVGEELHHLLRYPQIDLLGLRLQDAETQLEGGRVQIG